MKGLALSLHTATRPLPSGPRNHAVSKPKRLCGVHVSGSCGRRARSATPRYLFQPVTFGQKSQRPCTYLLSSISYLLFVEPRLIGNLDVVSVRVADVCREVVGTPFGPKARLLV